MRPVAKRFCGRIAAAAQGNGSSRLRDEAVSVCIENHDLIRLLGGDRVRAMSLQADRYRHREWLKETVCRLLGLRYGY